LLGSGSVFMEAGPSGRVLTLDLKRWRSALQGNGWDVYIYELLILRRNCTSFCTCPSFSALNIWDDLYIPGQGCEFIAHARRVARSRRTQ
jgi:hypothetical protein